MLGCATWFGTSETQPGGSASGRERRTVPRTKFATRPMPAAIDASLGAGGGGRAPSRSIESGTDAREACARPRAERRCDFDRYRSSVASVCETIDEPDRMSRSGVDDLSEQEHAPGPR